MTQEILALEYRQALLDQEIDKYVKMGYRIVSQTQTTAQLVKPKKFSLIWAGLWFMLFGIGLVVYVLYYWAKSDKTVYLKVDEVGHITKA